MTTARPGVSAGHEVNPDLNPDTEQDPYLTVTLEVDPEVLRIRIGKKCGLFPQNLKVLMFFSLRFSFKQHWLV